MANHAQNPAESSRYPEFSSQLDRIEGLVKVLNASASLCRVTIWNAEDAERLNRYCAHLQEDCDRLKEAAIALQVLIVGEDAQ